MLWFALPSFFVDQHPHHVSECGFQTSLKRNRNKRQPKGTTTREGGKSRLKFVISLQDRVPSLNPELHSTQRMNRAPASKDMRSQNFEKTVSTSLHPSVYSYSMVWNDPLGLCFFSYCIKTTHSRSPPSRPQSENWRFNDQVRSAVLLSLWLVTMEEAPKGQKPPVFFLFFSFSCAEAWPSLHTPHTRHSTSFFFFWESTNQETKDFQKPNPS